MSLSTASAPPAGTALFSALSACLIGPGRIGTLAASGALSVGRTLCACGALGAAVALRACVTLTIGGASGSVAGGGPSGGAGAIVISLTYDNLHLT